MLEFKPWSRSTLDNALKKYKQDHILSILDIELGGACNFKCIYCDTPKYTQVLSYSIAQIEQLVSESYIDWLFICGLGEPTVPRNRNDLIKVLDICNKYSIGCSMFSNIEEFDSELFSYVKNGVLYPLFKLDSFSVEKIMQIYGISKELAENQIHNILEMPQYVNNENGLTNICASIVPSSYNKNELKDLVKWCYDHSIFPLIGDLEDAGNGQDYYTNLKVADTELKDLKDYIKSTQGYDYEIPICPSVLFGLHIGYDGYVLVDEISGLSCHWFWLTEPKIMKLARFEKQSFRELSDIVIANRNKMRNILNSLLKNRRKLIFGGCGGDIVDLLTYYLEKVN